MLPFNFLYQFKYLTDDGPADDYLHLLPVPLRTRGNYVIRTSPSLVQLVRNTLLEEQRMDGYRVCDDISIIRSCVNKPIYWITLKGAWQLTRFRHFGLLIVWHPYRLRGVGLLNESIAFIMLITANINISALRCGYFCINTSAVCCRFGGDFKH